METEFWQHIDCLVATHEAVIDRPRGTAHPRYPDFIYPLDYGFLAGTKAMDGGGVDIFVGTLPGERRATAVAATVDLRKPDTELKIILSAGEADLELIRQTLSGDTMRCLIIRRP